MRNFFNTVFFALIVLFFVVFSLSNVQSVQLKLFGLLFRPVPVSLLVLIPFLIGVVMGSLLDLAERISLRREVKKLRKEFKALGDKSNSA